MTNTQANLTTVLRDFEQRARTGGYFELATWFSDCAEAVERNDKSQHLMRRFNRGSRPAIAADGVQFFNGVTESTMFAPQSWHRGMS